ncbi:MAG: phosphotransferase [Ktedonobacteraceae bacterium]|nr:phosphotransferase [Ktedonobacteraceae bacterium]
MDQRVAQILAQNPAWNGVAIVVTPLVGGITNQNYRLDIGEEALVLRIGGKGTHLLGIDRERECACTTLAAQAGVGAEVVQFFPSEDALVTRFIAGTAIAPEVATQPEMLKRIVTSMQHYHTAPDFPGTFSPFATVRVYHTLALAHGVTFPDTLSHIFALMERIEEALQSVQQIRSCHNDLLASNFIDDGSAIRIIDWEYAGMGDLFFDLGNFAINQDLNAEQCKLLLALYFGEVRPNDLAHLHLMRLGSDLRESFWGFLQLGISELDFDYHQYAYEHWERFLQNIATSPFEQWLQEVKHA